MCKVNQLDGDPIELAAIAIYDVDEDLSDESIGHLSMERRGEISEPRLDWHQLDKATQEAYRRRARAAFAAVVYGKQFQSIELQDSGKIQIGKRQFAVVEVV